MVSERVRNGVTPSKDWMTVPQAARRLGLARATVMNRALLGDLTFTSLGGVVFIARASVEQTLADQAQDAAAA